MSWDGDHWKEVHGSTTFLFKGSTGHSDTGTKIQRHCGWGPDWSEPPRSTSMIPSHTKSQ